MLARAEQRGRTGMTGAEWGLTVLLIISIFLNYIDRGSLSVAAKAIETDFSLSLTQTGSLFSAFFWTYALMQLFGIAGWLADRFPPGLVLAGGLVVWSGATVACGLATGFGMLWVARLLLGAGESLAYPCYSRLIAADIRQEHRGLVNALLDAGSKLGPSLGTMIGGLFLVSTGWRPFFIVLGVVSLLWLVPWVLWRPASRTETEGNSGGGPAFAEIVRSRSAWGAFLGHFCGNYFWFFLLTWLPLYLMRERNLSTMAMAEVSSVAYLAMAAATVAAGYASDRWIASGASATRVRKTIVVCGLACSTVVLPVAIVDSLAVSVGLLLVACMSFGVYTSNHWAITQTLAGPLAAGRWTSLQNGVGNLAGIAAAWLTGVLAERMNSFVLAFVVAAVVVLLGAVLWGAVVGPVEQVRWRGAEGRS